MKNVLMGIQIVLSILLIISIIPQETKNAIPSQ